MRVFEYLFLKPLGKIALDKFSLFMFMSIFHIEIYLNICILYMSEIIKFYKTDRYKYLKVISGWR